MIPTNWYDGVMTMTTEAEVLEQAQRLLETHGDKAGRQAAYNELEAEENGDDDAAHRWHQICLALKQMAA
jgi:hypothetical protein